MLELKKILKGDRQSLIKALSQAENLNNDEAIELIQLFKSKKKQPTILGITGTPGAGKSTFLNNSLKYLTHNNKKIGLLLIDPSSPLHGGALLGDRVRMSDYYNQSSVYIRSISNKGDQEGLNPFIENYLMLFCLFPFDYIFVETVGMGQTSSQLSTLVDRLLMIFDPGSGDGIQHLKSGSIELCDDVIISKADLFEAELVKKSLAENTQVNEENIFAVNLTHDNTLQPYFESMSIKTKQKSRDKIILSRLIKETKLELFNQLTLFSNSYLENKSISEVNHQVFQREFINFLKENC
jgi:LAO/AO transport system kinase